jgi:hypothetical protein
MKRIDVADIVEAAEAVARITGQTHVFIVGMASTAKSIPSLQTQATDDVDLFTPDAEACFLDEVITQLGEGSAFEARHGFYVERLGSWVLLTQPGGWMERALVVDHPKLLIRVLHPLDLLYNKLETGRKKDLDGVLQILKTGAVRPEQIRGFVETADTPETAKADILKQLQKVLRRWDNSDGSREAGTPP